MLANYVLLTGVADTEGRTHSQQQEINRRQSKQMVHVHQGRVSSEQQVCWQIKRTQHQEPGWQQTESISGKSGTRQKEPTTDTKVLVHRMTQGAGQNHSSGGYRMLGRW